MKIKKSIVAVALLSTLLVGCGNEAKTAKNERSLDNIVEYINKTNSDSVLFNVLNADYYKDDKAMLITFYPEAFDYKPYKDTAYFNINDFLKEETPNFPKDTTYKFCFDNDKENPFFVYKDGKVLVNNIDYQVK